MIDAEILYRTTYIPINKLAKIEHKRYSVVRDYLYQMNSIEFNAKRTKICYSIAKRAEKNAMFGGHPVNYIGLCEDGRGYLTIYKPKWYTGRKNSERVFVHSVIMCEALGITEIPSGFCIHHVNENTRDNRLTNLALMSLGAHASLHHR